MKSAPILSFEPRPSRIAGWCSALIAVLAITAIFVSGLPFTGQAVIACLVAIVLARSLRAQRIASGPRYTLQLDDEWQYLCDAAVQSVKLKQAHDLGFLIALQFRNGAGGRIDLALWPDSIPADTRRQLRVWLTRHQCY